MRTNDASVDETTLKLLRRHYENSMKLRQHQDEIDWTILKDIIVSKQRLSFIANYVNVSLKILD